MLVAGVALRFGMLEMEMMLSSLIISLHGDPTNGVASETMNQILEIDYYSHELA